MEEIWYDIEGFEGYYQISTNYRIRSVERTVNSKNNSISTKSGRILKVRERGGYNCVALSKSNIKIDKKLSRLIAIAFIPNPKNKPCVNHKNGIKTDDRIENLEWVTISENTKHAFDNGLAKGNFGDRNGNFNRKGLLSPHSVKVQCTATGRVMCQNEAAHYMGVSDSQMKRMLNGKRANWTTCILL